MSEEWRAVPRYEGLYEVSNRGRVRHLWKHRTPTLRKLNPRKDGYWDIQLRKGNIPYNALIHRLVAVAFLGQPPGPAYEVDHVNGNRADCGAGNLEWVTSGENQRRVYASGRRAKRLGEDSCNSKLTPDIVRDIRAASARGESYRAISARYGITGANVGYIVRRVTWKHL